MEVGLLLDLVTCHLKLQLRKVHRNNAMLSAIQGANSGINSASANLVKAEGAKTDFSQLIKALTAGKTGKTDQWDKSPGKVDYSTTPDYLGDISYGRTDSEGNFF